MNDYAIRDPLEGVIAGTTRKERYDNFTIHVLGKIWPETVPYGYAYDLWTMKHFARGDTKAYRQTVPLGKDPLDLSPEAFECFVRNIGTPDYVRVRVVPPELLAAKVPLLVVGGSCALETWSLKTIYEIHAGVLKGLLSKSMLTNFVKGMLDLAPTITHTSGAVLTGQKTTIHLIESDLWIQTVMSFGIDKQTATRLVHEAYTRITTAVARLARLKNPQATIIPINFDDLQLPQMLPSWFANIGIEHDPTYRRFEVLYTYLGDAQLALVKRALRNRGGHVTDSQRIKTLLQAQYHVRAKQIDHLTSKSLQLPNEVIMGIRDFTPEEKRKAENNYMFRAGVAVNKYVYHLHRSGKATAISVGFADLPSYGNTVQHETRDLGKKFKSRPEDAAFRTALEDQLRNPARLHRHNVDQYIDLLSSYITPPGERKQQRKVHYFPLRDNPFVHIAILFLFDPDFPAFLQDAVRIAEERGAGHLERMEANEKLRTLMKALYPKLAMYIHYLYGRASYEEAAAYESVYQVAPQSRAGEAA